MTSTTQTTTTKSDAAKKKLSDSFDNSGYSDYSDLSRDVYSAFWTDAAQADLVPCLFPTTRDMAKGTVRPVYPRGGFDPNYQALTPAGLDSLLTIAWENNNTPPTTARWSQLEGYRSSIPGKAGGIPTIIGAAIKPIGMAVVSVDIDLNFFNSDILGDDVSQWVIDAETAYRIRGNRNRITLLFRQSECLQKYFDREYPEHARVTYIHETQRDAKIEIAFREGVSTNVLGAHKTESSYQVILPDDDQIGQLTEFDIVAFIEAIKADKFSHVKADGAMRSGRMSVEDVSESPDLDVDLDKLKQVVTGANALKARFGVSAAISAFELLSHSSQAIVEGRIRYVEANRSVQVDLNDAYLFPDGFRRHTTWQAFTDIAFTFQFLEAFGVAFDPSEEMTMVRRIAENVQPDIGDVFISVIDASGNMVSHKCKKWSVEHILHMYQSEYRDSIDKCTVSPEFAHSFVIHVAVAVGTVIQNVVYSKQKANLEKQGKSLAAPTLDQSVHLSLAAQKSDESIADMSDDDLSDLFAVVFQVAGDNDSLIDDDSIDIAVAQRDKKHSYRVKATSDNWGLFPDGFAEHSRRYLRRQKGSSYASAVAIMAAMSSYAGVFQVTADPIDDDVFDTVSAADGRSRYALNNDGNMLVIMQLLTGDSGSGKSYVTKPLDVATRIASQAVNLLDAETLSFFRECFDDKGKVKAPANYNPVPGAIHGTVISPMEYLEIYQIIKNQDWYSLVGYSETFSITDHSAETAALRDAMMETETRIKLKELAFGKLFAGTFHHPAFLMFDEAGAFIEVTYQSSARITSFCELKAGNSKDFRRAKSNASGAKNSITFWAASMHGNLPLPKYLSTAYRADVIDGKAEGVLGRILTSYIERNDADPTIRFTSKYGGNSDEEILATLTTIAMLIPSAMRRVETVLGGKRSYFSASRHTGNFYMDVDTITELPLIHDRLMAKIDAMKSVNSSNTHVYAYDTYAGKIYEMLYTLSGGHKLMCDLIAVAELIIPKLDVRFNLGNTPINYKGWEISRYVKDRGMQSVGNHQQLLSSLCGTLFDMAASGNITQIDSPNISVHSLKVAELILGHHYDVLMFSETLYSNMFGTQNDSFDAAKRATASSIAERNSTGYVAYRIIDNLDRQIRKAASGSGVLRQTDVLRNMLHQAKKQKPEDVGPAQQLITSTFNSVVSRLVRDGHMTTSGTGVSWTIMTSYKEMQPLLSELRGNFASQM